MFRITRAVLPMFLMVGFGAALPGVAGEPTVVVGPGQSTPAVGPTLRAQTGSSESPFEVLVTVNGTPIVAADVNLAMRGGHEIEAVPGRRAGILENIIQQELARQRAVEIGLDADSRFQAELHRMETQLNAFKRRALSELYFRHEAGRQAEVSDAEAKQYFAENEARIRTESHVWQILERTEERVQKALNDMQQGASFEEVARRRFPNLPKSAGEPWDLGYLRWTQVPKAWRSVVYELENGEVSGVIRGPNHRFWIIQLIDTREDPHITFESVKPIIIGHLKNSKTEGLHEATYRNLQAGANILYAENTSGAEDTIRVPSAPPKSEPLPE